jgi:predicted alpha/beta hydrolase
MPLEIVAEMPGVIAWEIQGHEVDTASYRGCGRTSVAVARCSQRRVVGLGPISILPKSWRRWTRKPALTNQPKSN